MARALNPKQRLEVAGLLIHNVFGQVEHVLGDFDVLDVVAQPSRRRSSRPKVKPRAITRAIQATFGWKRRLRAYVAVVSRDHQSERSSSRGDYRARSRDSKAKRAWRAAR